MLTKMRLSLGAIAIASLAPCLAQQPPPPQGWVVIPLTEYNALRAKAAPLEAEPGLVPVEAAISRADYDLEVKEGLASGKVRLTIDVLKEGWAKVPVPPQMLVRDAILDGKPVSLIVESASRAGSRPTILLSKRGRSILTLDIAIPVQVNAAEQSLRLAPAGSGITRATVALPHGNVDLRAGGAVLISRPDAANGARLIAHARGSEGISIYWKRRVEQVVSTRPLRFRSAVSQFLALGEDSASVTAEIEVAVLQGVATQATVEIPKSVTVNQVSGGSVADWDAQPGRLLVTFLEPVERSARFVLTGEAALAREGQLDVPLLTVSGAEREAGGIAVDVLGAGEIKDPRAEGMDAVDASQVSESIASRTSPSLKAFRFRAGVQPGGRKLGLNVIRYAQQAVLTANVEEARYRVLMTQDGKALVHARYAVRNNQRNFLRVVPPSGASLWSAMIAGRERKPGVDPGGALLMPLLKSRAAEDTPAFLVELVYLTKAVAWTAKGSATLSLPALDMPVSKTGVELHYPPEYKLAVTPGPFRIDTYEPPGFSVSSPSPSPAGIAETQAPNQQAVQRLADSYRAKVDARLSASAGLVHAEIPAVGPSMFVASELTAENQSPALQLTYEQEKRRSAR